MMVKKRRREGKEEEDENIIGRSLTIFFQLLITDRVVRLKSSREKKNRGKEKVNVGLK